MLRSRAPLPTRRALTVALEASWGGSGPRRGCIVERNDSPALHDARPADAVLSEEVVDDPARLSATRVWIIDPLDGTREYTEAGRADWAVHVALWSGGRLAAGAVALPGLGLTLATDDPPVVPAVQTTAVAHRGQPDPSSFLRRPLSPNASTPSWCLWVRRVIRPPR